MFVLTAPHTMLLWPASPVRCEMINDLLLTYIKTLIHVKGQLAAFWMAHVGLDMIGLLRADRR